VGRWALALAEEDKQSGVSKRQEREEGRRREAEEHGAEDEEWQLFLLTPSFMASVEEE
jgi:hypothetical protein